MTASLMLMTNMVAPLRKRADGFDGLCRLLISQQVSTTAASAMQARFALLPDKSPAQLLAVPDEALAACGVSRPKQRYLRGWRGQLWKMASI